MNVLFDLDGTLTDPKEGIFNCIAHAFNLMKVKVPSADQLHSFIGPPLEESFSHFFSADHHRVLEATHLFRERYAKTGLFENFVYPGIIESLGYLHGKGLRLFVATSKPQVFAERIVLRFDLAPYFQNIFGAQPGSRTKKEDIIRYALQVEELDSANTVMVGDTKYDAIGARTHSIPCIGVLWGYGSRSELEEAGVKFLCESPKDLPNIIERLVVDNKT